MFMLPQLLFQYALFFSELGKKTLRGLLDALVRVAETAANFAQVALYFDHVVYNQVTQSDQRAHPHRV